MAGVRPRLMTDKGFNARVQELIGPFELLDLYEGPSQFSDWTAAGGVGVIPKGNYLVPAGAASPPNTRVFLSDEATVNGIRLPLLSISSNNIRQQSPTHLFVAQDTSKRKDTTAATIQRNVYSADGLLNPKALKVVTNIFSDAGTQKEYAVSGEVYQKAGGNVGNCVAVAGGAFREGAAGGYLFGSNLFAEDKVTYADPTQVVGAIGLEADIYAIGLDHPTLGNGAGLRVIIDCVAGHSPWPNVGNSEVGLGIRIRAETAAIRYGLEITDFFGNTAFERVNTAIRIYTRGDTGIKFDTAGTYTNAAIDIDADGAYGIALGGTYSTAAITMNSGQRIAFNSSGTVGIQFNTTDAELNIYNGTTDGQKRFSFGVGATPYLQLNNTQVVTTRRTGWTASTGTATRTAYDTATATVTQVAERLKALLDDLITHGLIGA